MAKIVELPRAEQVQVIDSRELLGDNQLPKIDDQTGLPATLPALQVSSDPPMTVFPQFFSPAECEHLIKLVEGGWMPSLVGGSSYANAAKVPGPTPELPPGQVENTVSQTRTSWSCMLRYAQTSVVERLEHRLAAIAGLPGHVAQLERMNMVRYAPGEIFAEHHDGKFRPKTIFVYLNELPEEDDGGDTFFPVLGYSFKPRVGTAVMWENAIPDGSKEDSRMVHAARGPFKGIKYGVNCFTNATYMRELVPTPPDVPVEQATVVTVANLVEGGPELTDDGQPVLRLYTVVADPKINAIPGFLSAQEVAELMSQVKDKPIVASGPFSAATTTIYQFPFECSPTIEAIELRCCAATGEKLEHLAKLRVVRPGLQDGLCNRGCGKSYIYVCISEADEVFFPRLGLRFWLGPGDALSIPNANFETGVSREEMRAVRVHRLREDHAEPAIGLDCFFHDNPLRAQQKVRKFVEDSEVGIYAPRFGA